VARFREEVVNVQFAELLGEYGLEANPETIKARGRPDVILNMGGLKVVIEGRFENEQSLKQTVRERIEDGTADISMGLVYPNLLREAKNLESLKSKIQKARYDGIACYFERHGVAVKEFQWLSLSDIVQLINSIFHLYVQNDLVREYVKKVEQSIEEAVQRASTVGLFFQSDVLIQRLKTTLGIRESLDTKEEKAED